MKRRKLLSMAPLGLLGLPGCNRQAQTGSAAVHSRPKLHWRLASSFPRSLDTIFGVAETFARRVAELTEGGLTIHASPAGELVPALEVLDAVQQGTCALGHSASYYFKGKNPALAFDCTIPFGLSARQQNAWMSYGGGKERMARLFADFNIVALPGGNTGIQMGGWFRREINSLSDLAGLSMRIPGFGGEVMSRMGVSVQVLGGPDIYPALERGAIDACEWVGPYDDEILGFHKVARHYYYPGWWEPGPQLSFYVNAQEWGKLPSGYAHALECAAAEANLAMLCHYDAKNPPAMARLLQAGVAFRPFPLDVMQAAAEHARAILEDHARADAGYRAILEDWQKFRASSNQWFSCAEDAFARFMFQTK